MAGLAQWVRVGDAWHLGRDPRSGDETAHIRAEAS